VSLFAQIAAAEAALVMTPKALMARRIRIVPAEPEPETNGSALSDEARARVAALYPDEQRIRCSEHLRNLRARR
jgi:hypothetical protein